MNPNSAEEIIQRWLSGGERQDFPWKVKLSKPVLTFQQRNVVRVTADIPADELRKHSIRGAVTFIIKVRDEAGKWLEGNNHISHTLNSKLDDNYNLEMESEVFLQPGRYTIGTIAFDSVLGERNVTFNQIQVPPLNHDPFPDLLSRLPKAEFFSSNTIQGQDAFASGRVFLPVSTPGPVQFDLLVDLSTREKQATRVAPPFRDYGRRAVPPRVRSVPEVNEKGYIDRLIQTASVLSAIDFQNGCSRVAAFDSSNRRSLLDAAPSETVDWQSVRADVLGTARDTVSVAALENRHDARRFFLSQLDKLIAGHESEQCQANSAGKPVHVVAILSHGLEFPSGSAKAKAENNCDCTVFYLRQSDTAIGADDLKGLLSPLSPKMIDFGDPVQFRKKLQELVQSIGDLSAGK